MPLQTDIEPDADWEQMKNWIVAGTIIETASGQIMRVQKVNRVNFVSMDKNGQLWNIRRHPSVKRAKRQDMWEGPVPENPFSSDIKLGSVVRLKNPKLVAKYGRDLYVVINLSHDTFKVAKLGGTSKNSYLHRLSTLDLELVTGSFTED